MNGDDDLKPLLNVRETAELLGVHPNTIGNWVRAGTIVSARVAGSKGHRFTKEEVRRVLKERGKPASSVAPSLRTDGPELVTANELNGWAARDDAKTTFPELMRRLLALTPGITNIDIRAHEGNAASGWDGTATSAGTSFLPAGELRMEFGTDQKIKQKAQSDWDKRVKNLPADKDCVFLFATPRNWPEHKGWASERVDESKFADVKAIDAHRLEGWLQSIPSVHYWISERLGYRPRDVQTIERWWSTFVGRMRVNLPPEFFAAGRVSQIAEFKAVVTESSVPGGVVTIQAPWTEEALAFTFAAVAQLPDLVARTVVVTDSAAWQRLTSSQSPLVLIPLFSERPDLSAAVDNRHRVVMIAGPDDLVRNGQRIILPKVERSAAREALKPLISDSAEAERMIALARRSTAAFVRSLARDSVLQSPSWLSDPQQAAVLAPLVLLGSWTTSAGDIAVVERMTARPYDEVEHVLSSLAGRPDAPFMRSGGVWRLTSPVEAAVLLLPRLTRTDREHWVEITKEVLLEPDPFVNMSSTERMTASINGTGFRFSETLRTGIAQTLALAAANSDDLKTLPPTGQLVNKIVHELLATANSDCGGAGWNSLAHNLPLLSEAAPDVFIDAVDFDLQRHDPILRTLFRDKDANDMFGPPSQHPSLLWAIENLCWSPDYFGRAAELLSQLSAIDPGGRLSNRPLQSLKEIEMGWVANSAATVEEKLLVVGRLFERDPDLGWQLAIALLPSAHSFSSPPHTPDFRDWPPARRSITFMEWEEFVHGLVELTLAAASDSAERWSTLARKIDELPRQDRDLASKTFRDVANGNAWTDDERHTVWSVVIAEAEQHEEYAEADWAMPADDVATLREIAAILERGPDPRRFAKLFDWRSKISGFKFNDPGYYEELNRLRLEALHEVVAAGPDALRSLVSEVKTPHAIGILAPQTAAPEAEILSWLESEDTNLRQAAFAFVDVMIRGYGITWALSTLGTPALLSPAARTSFMRGIPLTRLHWSEVANLDPELQDSYWLAPNVYQVPKDEREEAVPLLLKHGRQWAAVTLISEMIQDQQQPSVELTKSILNAMLAKLEPMVGDSTMDSYYIANVLQHMESTVPDDEDLPRYEFMFFELLHDHQPSRALYRELGRDSADFVNMIKAIYRADDAPARTLSPNEKAFAHLSWSVIREWRALPGLADDGTIDAAQLTAWVRDVRLALEESGRSAIGDEQIGQVLAASPVGSDGVWPAEAVRDLLDTLGNTRVDTGFHIGKMNQRGVTSRGVFDGGDQERALEAEYRERATILATKWPRTARILRGIADDYQQQARQNDAEAERRSDAG